MTTGTGTGKFAKMASIEMLHVRRRGQRKKGNKNRFYFLRLFSYMMKNSMARVKNLKNYLKQQYYVQAKQCILTGSAYQVKDM